MDRRGREPLELIDGDRKRAGAHLLAGETWPIGSGDRFRGVIDRRQPRREFCLREPSAAGRQASGTLAAGSPELAETGGAGTPAAGAPPNWSCSMAPVPARSWTGPMPAS